MRNCFALRQKMAASNNITEAVEACKSSADKLASWLDGTQNTNLSTNQLQHLPRDKHAYMSWMIRLSYVRVCNQREGRLDEIVVEIHEMVARIDFNPTILRQVNRPPDVVTTVKDVGIGAATGGTAGAASAIVRKV